MAVSQSVLAFNEDDGGEWEREYALLCYKIEFGKLTSGPIIVIFFDVKNGSFWGGSSNYGEDYGIAWE